MSKELPNERTGGQGQWYLFSLPHPLPHQLPLSPSQHKDRLLDDCHEMVDGEKIKKTKTSTIVDDINDDYVRKPP